MDIKNMKQLYQKCGKENIFNINRVIMLSMMQLQKEQV